MRYLENLNDTNTIKHGDSSETLRLSARNDNEPVTWTADDTATVHVNQVGKEIPAKLVTGSNNVLVDSADLADLAAGRYGLELWVTLKSGKTAIWPSDGTLEVTIDKNADEVTGDQVTTITLEDLQKRVDSKIADGLKNIKLDPSQIPSVDLSDYAKKSDVPQVVYDKTAHTLTVNGQAVSIPADVDLSQYAKLTDLPHVDLTPYLTKTDADSKYAVKADVPSVKYDKSSRTLTVDGQVVSLPASVDLSDYAKTSQLADYALKSSIPNVSLDLAKRTLTLNGVSVTIPQSVDLSQYALSSDVPSVTLSTDTHTLTVDGQAVHIPANVDLSPYAKSADVTKEIDQKIGSIPAVDLTGYVKKTDLADYARKTDIPAVPEIKLDTTKRTLTIAGQELDIPNAVDLSQYAKVEQVPKVALDAEKRVITINGESVKVPDTVDLSGYVTQAELTQKLADVQSGGKIDLTGYVTKEDADKTYETKEDARQLMPRSIANNIFARKNDLPKVTYDTTTRELKFTQNGTQPVIVDIPKDVDLTPYLKAATADATYAKKSDLPAAVDLTPYLKTTDADTKYAAKNDLNDYAKKSDLNNYVDANTFNENIAGMAGQIPQITYDSSKHTLNVNGSTVKLPADVDLSGYAKLSDLPKVDLTPYLKISDADAKYLGKDAVKYSPAYQTLYVNGQQIDFSNFTKTSTVTYDSSTHRLSVNGQQINIPAVKFTSDGFSLGTYDGQYWATSPYNSVTYTPDNRTLHVGSTSVVIPKDIKEKLGGTIWIYSGDVTKATSRQDYIPRGFPNHGQLYNIYKIDVSKLLGDDGKAPDGDSIKQGDFVIDATGAVFVSGMALPMQGDNNTTVYMAEVHAVDYQEHSKSGSSSVDLTPYLKSSDAEAQYVKKSAITYDKDNNQLTIGGLAIKLGGGSGSTLWFKSDAVDTAITWTYNGRTGYQTPISSLIGKGGDAATKVNAGDVVIDGTGKAFTVYGSTNDGKAQLIAIGSTAGKGIQSKNISDWNAYQGGEGTAPMQYIGKQSIKQALQLDNSKMYTMDLDAGTLVNETDKTTQKMLPGIYQLRDLSTDVDNLTVKSASNFGGNGGTPVQATITPYEIDVVLVNGDDVSKAWRSAWLADQSAWYGVTDKWHIEK